MEYKIEYHSGAAYEFLKTLNMAIPLQSAIHWGYVIAIIGCRLSGINPNPSFWVYLKKNLLIRSFKVKAFSLNLAPT